MPGESGEWLGRKSRSANVAVVRIPVHISLLGRLTIPQLSRFFQLGWPQGRLGTPHLWGPEDAFKREVLDNKILSRYT
jgi:hypothetical protein